MGGQAPIVVQSMTNTDTADIDATVQQVLQLARAGSELVRITVNSEEAARAVPHIREQLDKRGCNTPLIGDFHFNGHKLLSNHPACAEALGKYRINPGNVGRGKKKDEQYATMIEIAGHVKDGAMAYLKRQYRVVAIVFLVLLIISIVCSSVLYTI